MATESDYIRDNLPAGDPFPVATGHCIAKMDQNESPLDLPDEIKSIITNRLIQTAWTRYPQPDEYHRIKRKFADTLGVFPECLAITNGCDGAIQGIHFLSGGPKRKGLCFTPTYPMLHHAAYLAGTQVTQVKTEATYRIDPQFFSDYDLIMIANPNNPTGNLTSDCVLSAALDSGAMVFIDEAYFNFSGKTWIESVSKFPNLAIGRSCSKAMLAGVRLGALIASPGIIATYESMVTAPYHLSHLQLIVADEYQRISPIIDELVQSVKTQRSKLVNLLHELNIKTYPTETNFILFKVSEPETINNALLKRGVRIRDMSKIAGLGNHLRVTVGTPEENELFTSAIRLACRDLKS